VPIPPNPFFKDVKLDGKILIGFQSDINIVPNLEMINNGTIYLEDLQARQLGIQTLKNAKKKSKPVLQVEVIPGSESKAEDLSFRWNVTSENAKTLELQLYFDYPLNVSSNPVSILLLISCRYLTQFG
jgi:hypothetical protein